MTILVTHENVRREVVKTDRHSNLNKYIHTNMY